MDVRAYVNHIHANLKQNPSKSHNFINDIFFRKGYFLP